MNTVVRFGLMSFAFVLSFVSLGGKTQIANAYIDRTNCYSYDISSTRAGQTTSVTLKNGSTISIINTSPASILQSFKWNVNPISNSLCVLQDFASHTAPGHYLDSSFIADSGKSFDYTGSSAYTSYIGPPSVNGGLYSELMNVVFPNNPTIIPHPEFETLPLFINNVTYEGNRNLSSTIATEDAIIKEVATNKRINLNVQGSALSNGMVLSAPATNCVQVSGTGPRKVVFMRGNAWNSSVSDYITVVNDIINTGFKTIEPFKSHINQFSFYVDLKKIDQLQEPLFGDGYSEKSILDLSSCGNSGVVEKIYLYGTQAGVVNLNPAYTKPSVHNGVFIKIGVDKAIGVSLADIVIHESGHVIGNLDDEYIMGEKGSLLNATNCTQNPRVDYAYNGYIYGSTNVKGCSYTGDGSSDGTYYRPSSVNMMNIAQNLGNSNGKKFDIISCGYIIAGINGEQTTQYNAKKYWPECNGLDTIKEGYGVLSPPPSINNIDKVGTGNTFNVAGSGLSPTGNSIKLIPVVTTSSIDGSVLPANSYTGFELFRDFFHGLVPIANGQTAKTDVVYIIDGLASNGSSLTFSVPSTTPDGTYTVSVAGAKSSWKDTTHKIVVSGNGAGNPGTGTGTSTTTPPINPPVVTDPSAVIYSCPTGYTLSGTTCSKASVPTTTKYTCSSGTLKYYPPGKYFDGISTTYDAPDGVNVCESSYFFTIAKTTYTCPTGATKSGTQCTYPNIAATKSCSTGYVLSGTICTIKNTPLNLTASNTLRGQIKLSWSNNGVLNISSIEIERATGVDTTFTKIGSVGPTVTSYADTDTLPSTGYQYRIRMLSSNGSYGAYTPTVKSTTMSAALAAAPRLPIVKALLKGELSLSWAASSSDSVYLIERSSETSTSFIQINSVTRNTYIDKGLAASTLYRYRIREQLPGEVYSSYSMFVSTTTLARVSTPVMKVATTTSDKIYLTWTDTDSAVITGYDLNQITPSSASTFTNTLATSYTVENLKPLTKYCFTISATINPLNKSLASTAVCGTTKSAAAVVVPTPVVTPPPAVTLSATEPVPPPAVTPTPTLVTSPEVIATTTTPVTPPAQTTSIPATVSYKCPTGQQLSDTKCTSVVKSTATVSYACPTGYTRSSTYTCSKKSPYTGATVSTTSIATYSCDADYTLNTLTHSCSMTKVNSDATAVYSCPTGYTLDSVNSTCSAVVSRIRVATSTTTASIWDAIGEWFMGWFR